MKVLTLITALLLTLAMPASAQHFAVSSKAYEVNGDEFRMPVSTSGTISFKACAECNYMTRRVTPNTRWTINKEPVKFTDFRKAYASAPRDKVFVTVVHHLQSDLITEVTITIF